MFAVTETFIAIFGSRPVWIGEAGKQTFARLQVVVCCVVVGSQPWVKGGHCEKEDPKDYAIDEDDWGPRVLHEWV